VKRGLDAVRKVLAILPVVTKNQGIRVSELSRQTGIPEKEILTELPQLVNLCGVPPYSPVDLVDLSIQGDRVSIRFAEPFGRPVRLTLAEALALFMALAGWEESGEGPFARAVLSIREKVRAALSPEIAEELNQTVGRISAVEGPGRAAGIVSHLKDALNRQVEVDIEYFSRSSGTLSTRRVRPYGIYEQSGRFYLAGWSDPPGRIITLRADRMRRVTPTEREYEIPVEFEVATLRREIVPRPEAPKLTARIRFDVDASRWAREFFPATTIEEEEDGAVVATVRTSGRFWLVSELLLWGGRSRVLEPEGLREELVARARETLAQYG